MDAVGDEHDRQSVGKAQCPLDDIVVPVDDARAAVAQVGKHRQSRIHCRLELVQTRIAMPGGNPNALIGKKSGHSQAVIAFGGQGDQTDQPFRRVQ